MTRVTVGVEEYVEVPEAEMYGERFDVPPETLVFNSWFEGVRKSRGDFRSPSEIFDF